MNPQDLIALKRALAGKPKTARQLAERLGCSLPTVYARLARLAESGVQLVMEPSTEVKTGPRAVMFCVKP